VSGKKVTGKCKVTASIVGWDKDNWFLTLRFNGNEFKREDGYASRTGAIKAAVGILKMVTTMTLAEIVVTDTTNPHNVEILSRRGK